MTLLCSVIARLQQVCADHLCNACVLQTFVTPGHAF